MIPITYTPPSPSPGRTARTDSSAAPAATALHGRCRLSAALITVAALTLSGCSFGTGAAESAPRSQAAQTPSAQADPAIVEDDGFYRANTLPTPVAQQVIEVPSAEGMTRARMEVLSLDSDGTHARMVLAWLPPVDGPVAQPEQLVAEAQSANGRPWVRLVDTDKRTLAEPLQVDSPGGSFSGTEPVSDTLPAAAAVPQRKGAAVSSYAGGTTMKPGPPEHTELIYLDFPAPASDTVTVFAGDAIPPLPNVPVSSDQRFDSAGELAQFRYIGARDGKESPGDYGAGATRSRVVPLDLRTESVTGASVEDRGKTTSLSIRADVLFALDADTLDATAGSVIDSAAAELTRSAKGRKVTIEGHTDDQGEDAYNQSLSERRAASVKVALEPKLSGAGITLETKGYGEKKPAVPNVGADGKPIEKNRALNRRVSFTYAPTAEVNPNLSTGQQLPDLPQLKPADTTDTTDTASRAASGPAPIASGILSPPPGGSGPPLRIDVTSLTGVGDYYALSYTFRTADGTASDTALAGNPSEPEKLIFGQNAQTTLASYATSAHLALHDEKANLLALPVTAGGADCLCAQNGVRTAAFGEPITQFAYFPRKGLSSTSLSLRIADSGRLSVPVG